MSLRSPRARIRIAAAVAVAVFGLGLVLTGKIVDALDETREATVDRAYEARLDAEELDATFTSRVANARGYMLSGDASFLRGRAHARAEFAQRLTVIRETYPSLRSQLAPIDLAIANMDEASDAAVARRTTNYAEALAQWEERVPEGQAEVTAILRATVAAALEEQGRARLLASESARRGRLMLGTLAVAVIAALGLLLSLAIRGQRELLDGALQNQERELLQILEHVPVGLAVRSADGSPYYANRTARELLGPTGVTNLYEAGTDQLYDPARMPITRALAGEEIEVSDMELRRDGLVIPLHVRGGSVRGPDGAIAYAVAAFQDVRELHRHAMRDSLTGLANRASVHQTFRRDRQVADRSGRPLSVGLIDLDHFKSINDRHGHAMGDRVLQAAATKIVESLRAADVVARWGGEEILVILPDTDVAGARRAIDKTLVAVRGLTFLGADHEPFEVTFSAGVAMTRPGENLDSVVSRADAALYKAKRAGRCRVFDESVVAVTTSVLAAVEAPVN